MTSLEFRVQSTGAPLRIVPEIVAVAGYTGRDQAAVRHHIAELAEQGIAPPPQTPTIYPMVPGHAVISDRIDVTGERTAGEAEFVLILVEDEIFVGLGSDHTDRELEKLDIAAAKQICPKPLGPEVWRLAEVEDHWDQLVLRSWTGAERTLYQEGTVDALLHPRAIIDLVRERIGVPLRAAIISCGTVPLLGGSFVFTDRFSAELHDPVRDRRLTLTYTIDPIRWLRD